MVALASSPSVAGTGTRGRELAWTLGAVAIVLVGASLRLVVGGSGIGALSATVMAILLAAGVWAAARLSAGPRTALLMTAVVVALFDLAALPARNPSEFDDLEALYRTDQQLTVRLGVPTATDAAITLLAQPVFQGARPSFSLGGTINGEAVGWDCTFTRGLERFALPVPRARLLGGSALDVALQLTGSPSRESDYLVVYASSKRGGPLLALEPSTNLPPDATVCAFA